MMAWRNLADAGPWLWDSGARGTGAGRPVTSARQDTASPERGTGERTLSATRALRTPMRGMTVANACGIRGRSRR